MKREDILKGAHTCVCTDRNKQYGEPEDSFKAIADTWTGYLRAKGYDITITSTDAALMLIQFKIARSLTAKIQKPDTFVDIAGYAACAGELATGRDTARGAETVTQTPRRENADTCVCCGDIIPEGRHICINCMRKESELEELP